MRGKFYKGNYKLVQYSFWVVLAFGAFSTSALLAQQHKPVAKTSAAHTTKTPAKNTPEAKFVKSWDAFVKAVTTGDMKAFKEISTDCLYCNYCLYNTDKETKTYVDSMKKDPEGWTYKVNNELQYLPIDKFLKEDFADVFPASVKPKLKDKAGIVYEDGEKNRKTYQKICITPHPISGHEKLIEVIINDKGTQGAMNRTLTFIEVKDGYKFCGFSTIH